MKGKDGEISKLSELQDEIRQVLQGNFQKPRWVVAEINEIKENLYQNYRYLLIILKEITKSAILI